MAKRMEGILEFITPAPLLEGVITMSKKALTISIVKHIQIWTVVVEVVEEQVSPARR
jgi:hypothetical protein